MRRPQIIVLLLALPLWGGPPLQKYGNFKSSYAGKGQLLGRLDRKSGVHDGNKIRVKFFNFGPVGGPNRVNPWPRLEWPAHSGHEYLYEMGPIFGARVWGTDPSTQQPLLLSIVDDPIQDGGDEDFEPLHGYANPAQDTLAFSTKPHTWPSIWPTYITIPGDTVQNLQDAWPGQYGAGITVADQESYYVMTDSANTEFLQYYDPGNGKLGLGIEVSVRGYQWSALPAENILIWSYEVRNVSSKDIDSFVVGYFLDARIGGPGSDFSDDRYGFDPNLQLVYLYDDDNWGIDAQGRPYSPVAWLGFLFLESPENATDGIDNDGDGLVDERQDDGIDNDGDWDATDAEAAADPNDLDRLSDDVGADGIPNTGDIGEGDGLPTPGEPDFEFMDPDEKDELGLTSARFFGYGAVFPAQDSAMLEMMRPGNYDDPSGLIGDYITLFASGFFPLPRNAVQRYSIAVVMGNDSASMVAAALRAREIYRRAYRFPRPPEPPKVHVDPGEGYVRLYWEANAEVGRPDFEGYAVYRSEDGGVTWGDPITDYQGHPVYTVPLTQCDRIDGIQGMSRYDVNGARFNLGEDTGLCYEFVDSSVVPGKHYLYAVTAYTRDDTTLGLPPLESSKLVGSPNVVEVIPARPAADSGWTHWLSQSRRVGTGRTELRVAFPELLTGMEYRITFDTAAGETTYSVLRHDPASGQDTLLLQGISRIHGETDAPFFDGIRLVIQNDPLDFDTAFVSGPSGSNLNVFSSQKLPAGGIGQYYAVFYDSTVYTTPFLGHNLNFLVFDQVSGDTVDVEVVDDGDSVIPTPGDALFILDTTRAQAWKFVLGKDTTVSPTFIPPAAGDTFWIRMHIPFTPQDTLWFATVNPQNVQQTRTRDLKAVRVVPNPYVATSLYEVRDPNLQYGRGPRELHFINLPPECTIRIFTLSGELVTTLEHHKAPTDPTATIETWNLQSREGLEVASGLYIYHITTPDGASVTGKLAILK